MTKKRSSQSRKSEHTPRAVGQEAVSLQKKPTAGQLIFNMVLAVLGLFVAAIMFSLGISWAGHGSLWAGIGLIFAGLVIFWRGGSRLSVTCAEIRLQRQK
ncbi:MAG: hypothetical protein JXR85_05010 [Deltaproteobacteria bacterium]|nr:hypothetical protein [Deltaproteobacteria bacterium]